MRNIGKMRHAALVLSGLVVLSGCVRMDESAMRSHLERWFALGETMAFSSDRSCAAGTFRVVHGTVASSLPMVRNVAQAVRVLDGRGAVAIDQADVSPDQAMVDMANTNRSLGMQMRRAGLEGRLCMDEVTESAFAHLLGQPGVLLAFDREAGALILLDRQRSLLVVAMGEGV